MPDTPTKRQFLLTEARRVADELVVLLNPFYERIVVAGSIRRKKPYVGDIELLCVPKITVADVQVDMFTTETRKTDELDAFLTRSIENGSLFDKRLNKNGAVAGFGLKNKLLVHLPSGIPVDVFSTTIENWGMSLVVRTGPAEFNVEMMSAFRRQGREGHAYAGVTDKDGTELQCPDEETVFRILGRPYQDPEARS